MFSRPRKFVRFFYEKKVLKNFFSIIFVSTFAEVIITI